MIETTLKIDSLDKNIEYTGTRAIIQQIYNLVLMKPGTDPLNPEKGCDARSYYYQFKDSSVLQNLEIKIQEQIRKYTPYTVSNVVCRADKNKAGNYILRIVISMSRSSAIVISTNGDRSAVNTIGMQ